MKVLIICKYGKDIQNNITTNLNNISSVFGYFFYHNLKRFAQDHKFNLEITCENMGCDFTKLDNFTHCFYLFNRGIYLLNKKEYQILRSKISGKIFTIAPTSKIQGNEDYLLFFAGKQKERTLRINLVSDELILKRNQDDKKITILVDHEYYGDEKSRLFQMDKTKEIITSLLEFKKNWKGKPIEIIQINTGVPDGYSIINSLKDMEHYDRLKATSFENIFKIYCKSDMFIVTHPEALGLSCVECNQAGCKVISPDGYIKPDYAKDLDLVYIKENQWDWEKIINSLNSFRTKRKVRNLTYMKAIRLIFKKLKL